MQHIQILCAHKLVHNFSFLTIFFYIFIYTSITYQLLTSEPQIATKQLAKH